MESCTVILKGKITKNFEFDKDLNSYKGFVDVARLSGTIDTLPIIVSDKQVDITYDRKNKYVEIGGALCSCNVNRKLILYVQCESIEEVPFEENDNFIEFDGYVCKKPIYRETPLGREIADLMMAVNYTDRQSAYIPCIMWGRNAKYAESMNVGCKLHIEGRIQSREYKKMIDEETVETRIAYEVSVMKYKMLEEKQ